MSSIASNAPHNASCFEFHKGPSLLVVDGGSQVCSANVGDEAYRAIRFVHTLTYQQGKDERLNSPILAR